MNLDLDHFRARILQDALTEATAQYWLHRAQQFDDAAPRPGDYQGNATPLERQHQAIRSRQTADNCRRHARLITETADGTIAEDIWAAVREPGAS
jgi:hypothetical protein